MKKTHSGTGRLRPAVVSGTAKAESVKSEYIEIAQVWRKLVYGQGNRDYRSDAEQNKLLMENLATREVKTLQFLKQFVSTSEAIPTPWIIGVLTDGFSDQEVRDFCKTALFLGPLVNRFERDELLGLSKGMYRYLNRGEQLGYVYGDREIVATSVLRLTAITWLHAPESLTDAVTEDPLYGIYLTDMRTAELVIKDPQRTDEIVAFIKEYGTSKYEDIVGYFNLAPVLREGAL